MNSRKAVMRNQCHPPPKSRNGVCAITEWLANWEHAQSLKPLERIQRAEQEFVKSLTAIWVISRGAGVCEGASGEFDGKLSFERPAPPLEPLRDETRLRRFFVDFGGLA